MLTSMIFPMDTSSLGTALSNINLVQALIADDSSHRDWLIVNAVGRGLSIAKVCDATGLSRNAVLVIVANAKSSAA